ncbi:MAG: DUF3488 domain-containing protein [Acidobacteriota bacterium]|nr:MAG: DUF3488 domain-containing protein [Acidobacteriota bacterium]
MSGRRRASSRATGPTPASPSSPSTAELLALIIAALAAFGTETIGPAAFAGCVASLIVGFGRARGWKLSRALDRPRLFIGLAAAYLPAFVLDLLYAARTDPVPALARLVVFLVAAEVMAGSATRRHRAVMLGLLLIIAASAETTDAWFLLPLAAFVWAAVHACAGVTLVEAYGGAARLAPAPRIRGMSGVAALALLVGLALFFLIPHVGSGWGRQAAARRRTAGQSTGLSDHVELGSVGRVKKRHAVVFRARLDREDVAAEQIYWRARAFQRWTGSGWNAGESHRASRREIGLPARQRVSVLERNATQTAGLVATINLKNRSLSSLPVPGPPVWARTGHPTRIRVESDGSLSPTSGGPPRGYEVGVAWPGTDAPHAEPSPSVLDTGGIEPRVVSWARSVAPGVQSAEALARAFVDDLTTRAYSLDTRQIDPRAPLGSFLDGAAAHCEYFASAMALGLRLRGVPARVVVGYLGADRIPLTGRLVVRDARAHLWVEAWLPARGWVRFDPTPSAVRTRPAGPLTALWSGWEWTVMVWDTWVIGLDLDDQANLFASLFERLKSSVTAMLEMVEEKVPLPWIVPPSLIGLGIWLWRRRSRVLAGWGLPRGSSRGLPPHYRRLLRLGAARGVRLAPAETTNEFARRAGAALGAPRAVAELSRLYEQVRFGGRPLSASDERRAATLLTALRDTRRQPSRPATARSEKMRAPGQS